MIILDESPLVHKVISYNSEEESKEKNLEYAGQMINDCHEITLQTS